MSENSYILPSGGAVSVSTQAVSQLVASRDGEAALVYLYVLSQGGRFDPAKAAQACGMTAGQVSRAMDALGSMGLVALAPASQPEPVVREELPEYTIQEIRHELEEGSDFKNLVDGMQSALGRIFSSDDLIRLFGIYDYLGLPPQVILLLAVYCKSDLEQRYGPGRRPTMRYIEKAAYTWEREGIFSLELAEKYLDELSRRRDASQKLLSVLNIRGRALTSTEQKYVDRWSRMDIQPEAIAIAYDRTVTNTGKLVWKYMDSILSDWHRRGIRTARQVEQMDTKPSRPKKNTAASSAGGGGQPTQADIDRLRKLRDRMREGD